MNYWLGVGYTMHLPREILARNDISINTPILPIIQELKHKWVFNLIDEKKSIMPAEKRLFYTADKEEGNIGTHDLRLDDDEAFFKYCLPNTPSGSRFWFFKTTTIDLYLQEYKDALKNVLCPNWIAFRKKQNPQLTDLSDEKIAELAFIRLDQMADKYGADKWKPFTPNDYFNNGDQSETPLLFRLYTKP